MITKYKLEIKENASNSRSNFEVSYKDGRWYRLIHKSGTVNPSQHLYLMQLIPQYERDINSIDPRFNGRVNWQPINKKPVSLHNQFIGEYKAFYNKTWIVPLRFGPAEGMAVKKIISHLKSIAITDDDTLKLWVLILDNWNTLDEFYQKQSDVKQINSNLNAILRQMSDKLFDHSESSINNKFQNFLNKTRS